MHLVLDKEEMVVIDLVHACPSEVLSKVEERRRVIILMQNNLINNKIRRLSFRQLKALSFLCQANSGLASSSPVGIKMGVVGKSLGGVFSSLSRQKIGNQSLVIPFGRGDEGRGLRWKINTSLISIKDLETIVNELLRSWEGG